MAVDHIPDELYYWPASLDNGMQPGHELDKEYHIFVHSKAHWDRFEQPIRQYAGEAGDGLGIGNAK